MVEHQAGRRLQQLMKQRGIDDTGLSQATKVAKTNIFRLRNALHSNPTLGTLKPLASFFGITVSQLIGESPLETQRLSQPAMVYVPLIPWSELSEHGLPQLVRCSSSHEVAVNASAQPAFACELKTSQWLPSVTGHVTVVFSTVLQPQHGDMVLVPSPKDNVLELRCYQNPSPGVKTTVSFKAQVDHLAMVASQSSLTQVLAMVSEIHYLSPQTKDRVAS